MKRTSRAICFLTVGTVVVLVSPVARGGELQGSVTYDGPVPEAGDLPVTQHQDFCGESVPDESLVVGEKGALANVVVWVVDPPAEAVDASTKPETVTLDQRECRFVPHVLAAQAGARLVLQNSDPILHNAHGREGKTTRFNLAFPIRNQKVPRELRQPGVIRLQCDAGHTWMSAWIHVFEHPFFDVTGADGSYRLQDLPAGTYNVEAWHEKLGRRRGTVTIKDQGQHDFHFEAGEKSESEG